MKYLWGLVALAVFLRVVSNQEDLTDEEISEQVPEESEQQQSERPTPPPFEPPTKPSGDVYFSESFSEGIGAWVISEATNDDGTAIYDGEWKLEPLSTDGAFEEDDGLVLSESAKHYAIAVKLDRPFLFDSAEGFVVQYEINFQNGLTCGGAYIKLLTTAENLNLFQDKTPFSIMFGPDKCGTSSKVHFIVQFKNPVTGEIEEKHSKQSTDTMEFFNDKKTHLFALLIRSDGVYHVVVDQIPFLKGNLLEDMTPPIVPLQDIDDPEDRMPESWDEREKIPDPEAVKPDDWDEDAPARIEDPDATKPDRWLDDGPDYIPDPDANIPEDWDEEEDGEYEPPMIPNPACEEVGCGVWTPPVIQNPSYKGKWKPPLIDNSKYDGKWSPRKIDNPSYFEDATPFYSLSPISALGFELWTMSEGIYIDNIIVCGELAIANNYAREGWVLKMQRERTFGGGLSLNSWINSFVELANTYPYLWALYAIAVVMPFVCCVGCCCIRSKPKTDEAARRKKTDEPSPDDKPQEEEEDKESEITPVGSTKEDEETFIGEADEKEGGEDGGGQAEGGENLEDDDKQAEQTEDSDKQAEDDDKQAEGGDKQAEGGDKQAEGGDKQAEGGDSQAENGENQVEDDENQVEDDENQAENGDSRAENGEAETGAKQAEDSDTKDGDKQVAEANSSQGEDVEEAEDEADKVESTDGGDSGPKRRKKKTKTRRED